MFNKILKNKYPILASILSMGLGFAASAIMPSGGSSKALTEVLETVLNNSGSVNISTKSREVEFQSPVTSKTETRSPVEAVEAKNKKKGPIARFFSSLIWWK